MRRVAAAVLVLVLPACGAATPDERATDVSVPAPVPTTSRPTNPAFDFGDTVTITEEGLVPEWLVSVPDASLQWVNETGGPVEVTFDSGEAVTSGTIAPGASWTWRAGGVVSLAYHTSGSVEHHGQLQILPPAE